jgi:hypothetical protein
VPKKLEYLIRFKSVPVNGHVSKADILVLLKGSEAPILTDRVNPQDGEERLKLGRRWSKKLNRTPDEIADAINKQWCQELKSLKTAAPTQEQPEKRTQAQDLLELAGDAEYFHAPDSVAYATVRISDQDERRETFPVRGQMFRSWLARRYYIQSGKAPGSQTLHDVVGVLEGKARYDGPAIPVHVRVAEHEGNIYIDLGGDDWRAVEITTKGWRVVDTYPVRFRRPKGVCPLPVPVAGATFEELFPFVNVEQEDWLLVAAWLLAALRPRGPFPVLVLHGEQGACKSTTARVLRALVDPSAAMLRSAPRDDRDVIIAATNSWVVALDNLSTIKDWLSDALCRLATGGGFSTRQLYSDSEEAIFDVQRPVILTGIEELPSRGDLLDRALIVECPVVDDDRRQTEREFYSAFQNAAPLLFGAFLTLVSGALRELPGVTVTCPRMADFAVWAVAGMRALGLRDEDFLDPYIENQARSVGLTLEDSPLTQPLQNVVAQAPGRVWEGLPMAMLTLLCAQVDEKERAKKTWPKTARKLSGMLRRLAPALRRGRPGELRINVSFDSRTNRGSCVRVESLGMTPGTGNNEEP